MKLLLYLIFSMGSLAFGTSEILKSDPIPSVRYGSDSPMEIYFLYNYQNPFSKKCSQKILPNPKCFSIDAQFQNRGPFLSSHFLPFQMFHNLIRKVPLYVLNNHIARTFDQSITVFNHHTNQEAPRAPDFLLQRDQKVPRTMHKIWISKDFEIPEDFLKISRQSISDMSTWTFFFWVMDFEKPRRSAERLRKKFGGRVVVKLVDEILESMTQKVQRDFHNLVDSGFYAKASDLLRLYVLYEHGGVFTDLDISFKMDISFLLNYDLTVFMFRNQISFCAEVFFLSFSPKHPALKRFMEIWEHIEEIGKTSFKVIEAMEVHWMNYWSYALSLGIWESGIGTRKTKQLYLSFGQMKQMISHVGDLSWGKGKYGNKLPEYYDFGVQMNHFDHFVRILSRPLNISLNHF